MLAQRYSPETLNTILRPQSEWQPYPTITVRKAWDNILSTARTVHLQQGEQFLGYSWPSLPATLFLEYARNGDRERYQLPHFARRAALGHLVIAECIENQARFLDDIVNGIWAICEETYWGIPAHVGVQVAGDGLPDSTEPTVDLFAAETSSLLAWTHYLLGEQLDSVSPLVRPRIAREIDIRILTPNLERDDFWWMGFVDKRNGRRVNNWNPWICSNWLASALLMERDETRRQAMVAKILRSMDKFIDPHPLDGGCDEGPNYWGRAGASLFDCLELLYSATDGQIDLYDEPLIQEIGRFIHRVHIDEDYYINFADAPALVTPDPALVFHYGQRIQDESMMALGRWLAARQEMADKGITQGRIDIPASLGRLLPALFGLSALVDQDAIPPLPRDVWLPEIEVMVARDEPGHQGGFYLAAKGGHNDESHNHNDIGNFVVYGDGKPIIVDAGVETYTAKTFSWERYDIWTMQSGYHSLLPTVDGVMQQAGARFKASDVSYHSNDEEAQVMLNIASAYPPEACISSWQRTITLLRGQQIRIEDSYDLSKAVNQITLSLLTPCAVDLDSAGVVLFKEAEILEGRVSGTARLSYDGDQMQVHTETIPINDERLGSTWGSSLTRILFEIANPSRRGLLVFEIL